MTPIVPDVEVATESSPKKPVRFYQRRPWRSRGVLVVAQKPFPKNGYRELAFEMAKKESDLAIFRRFGELNMLNLLSLQAELIELQGRYKRICEIDDTKGKITLRPAMNGNPAIERENPVENRYYAYSFRKLLELDKKGNRRSQHEIPVGMTGRNQEIQDTSSESGMSRSQTVVPSEGINTGTESASNRNGSITEFPMPQNIQGRELMKIRKKLNEYNKALWHVARLESLDRPSKGTLECLQLWLVRHQRKHDAQSFGFLRDLENYTWNGTKGLDDFLTIQAPKAQRDVFQERMTAVIRAILGPVLLLYDWIKYPLATQNDQAIQDTDSSQTSVATANGASLDDDKNVEQTEREIDESNEVRLKLHYISKIAGDISAFFIAMLAALCPILSILVLFFIKHTLKRIYALMGLTVLFAIAIKCGTSARSMDVFAVTAAFVAVEVVFVANPGN